MRRRRSRRPKKVSQGELQCGLVLQQLGFDVMAQPKIDCFLEGKHPRWSYDFAFAWGDRQYLVEYDGNQHFEFTPIFHSSEQRFHLLQTRDVHKTAAAMMQGYYVIRLDAKSTRNISEHITAALQMTHSRLYVSHPERYSWLLSAKVRANWLAEYATPQLMQILQNKFPPE